MEEWKLINGYETHEVSSLGRIRAIKTGKLRKLTPNERGYVRLQLKNFDKTLIVHKHI